MSTYRFSNLDTDNKYYADVVYELKDLAKEKGAKWDWKLKKWYFENKLDRHNWDMLYGSKISDDANNIDRLIKNIALFDKMRLRVNEDALSIYISYNDLICYLFEKYGPVRGDYFTEDYKPNYKAYSRTKEGLEVHHIDEYKYLYLSDPDSCKRQNVPFECQKANRLVYCNKIEHLLLHIRIVEEYHSTEIEKYYQYGIKTLISRINDYYEYDELPEGWERGMVAAIADKFDDYILLLYQITSNLGAHEIPIETIGSIVFSSRSGQPCESLIETIDNLNAAIFEMADEE